MPSGYSGTPLAKKLGFKPGHSVLLVNEPAHYLQLFDDLPAGINWKPAETIDVIHFFTRSAAEFRRLLPEFKERIAKNGMIWISWPKRSSKIISDVDENLIRNTALSMGLVDIKVCAIDEVWSGLKLVWRKENR